MRTSKSSKTTFEIIDRLHSGRAVRVSADRIVQTVSAWLAELGVDSPLAVTLARAATIGDWPTVHAIADSLSVDVMVAA